MASDHNTLLGKVTALYDFSASDQHGLSFKKGDIIQVYQCLETGWWDGSIGDSRGWFPSNFTTALNQSEADAKKSDWVKQKSSSGSVYYYNKVTGDSRWDRPADLSEEPEEEPAVDEQTEEVEAVEEKKLPPGWTMHENDQGLTFYFHAASRKVQLNFPEEGEPKPEPKVQAEGGLPENWGEKVLPDGRVYFYNMVTNETTWKRPDNKATVRKAGGQEKRTTEEELTKLLKFQVADKAGDQKASWTTLSQGVLGSLSDLSEAAKVNKKDVFVNATKITIKAIQVMFKATGTYEINSPQLVKSKILATHHREITDNLSKLVLASKLASGVWPPPDAPSRVLQVTLDIVKVLTSFMNVAIDLGIPVEPRFEMPVRTYMPPPKFVKKAIPKVPVRTPQPPAEILKPIAKEPVPTPAPAPVSQPAATVPVVVTPLPAAITKQPVLPPPIVAAPEPEAPPKEESEESEETQQDESEESEELKHEGSEASLTSSRSSLLDEETHENVPAEDQTDAYRVADLDVYSKQILRVVAVLIEAIKKSGVQRLSQAERETLFVQPATKMVVIVGKIMSIADEIEELESSPEFKVLKRALYTAISSLVAAAKQAADPLAPSDAIRQMMTTIQAVVNSVRQVIVGAKNLVAKKEQRENEAIMARLDGNDLRLSKLDSDHHGRASFDSTMSNASDDSQRMGLFRSESQTSIGSVSRDDSDDDDVPVKRKGSSKLANFFGEAPPTNRKLTKFFGTSQAKESTKAKIPPYLRHDFKHNELIFNMEGKVKGGTLPALVERLTQHDNHDTEFMNAFLLTYKSFTTPTELLKLVIQRFSVVPLMELTPEQEAEFNEKKLTPIRLRVTNVLKTWLETYYEDFSDKNDFKILNDFLNGDLKTHLKSASEQLKKIIEKKNSGTITRKMVFSGQAPLPIVSKSLSASKLKFTDLDPLEIARQLTLMESKIFNTIQPNEFLGKSWSSSDLEKSPNIRQLIERANHLTAFVVEMICMDEKPNKRAEIMKHLILVAEKCLSLNNFNSLMAILAGLSSAPIHRLKRTWALLNNKTKTSLENLRQMMDHAANFARYREALHSVNPPCVPFLGVYLTDLTFIEDGNPDHLKGTALINIDKRIKVANVIQEIQQYQTAQYCLQAVPIIENYFTHKFKTGQSIDQLYDLSLQREPRETNDEVVLRLLAESGLY